jgi:tetratricopeptide (TPR) repeat protein
MIALATVSNLHYSREFHWIAARVRAHSLSSEELADKRGILSMKWLLLGLLSLASAALSQQHNPAAIVQANLGVNLAKQAKYREAIAAYRRAATLDPTLPGINLNIGLAWFKLGDFRQAIAAFDKEPPSDRLTTLVGMSYFGLAQYKEAAARLKPLADAQPENTELVYLLAKCYVWARDTDAGMALFRKLLEHDPDSAAVHMLMGEALDSQFHADEAIKELEIAAKNGPTLPDVHFGLGYLYWKQKRYGQAKPEFELELKNNPSHSHALVYLGDLEMRAGKNAEALVLLKKALELQKDLHLAHLDMGMIYQQDKRKELAVAEFHEAIRTDANNYDAHYRLARLLKEMGRKAEADSEFAIVQKLHDKKTDDLLVEISGPR